MRRPDAPDPTAWCLHAHLHREVPRARCVLHTHMPFATALASLKDFRLLPIDQNACRFFRRVGYAEDFGGMLLADDEARKVRSALGDLRVLVMRGHGVMVAAESVARAFDLLFYFERTCKNQWLAMAAGRELHIVADDIAEKTARQWEKYEAHCADAHLAELKAILDAENSDYRN
jgi:ribulose-5-phosphate 4-epimerase/fuculose-1-phosphate aldolase